MVFVKDSNSIIGNEERESLTTREGRERHLTERQDSLTKKIQLMMEERESLSLKRIPQYYRVSKIERMCATS